MNTQGSINLVNLAKKYKLELIQVGDVYQACCPFHNDSTPSFTIYPNDNKFYCFGCKVFGGPRRFLELIDPDAVKKMDFTVLEMHDKLSKYRFESRNMKKSVLLVSAGLMHRALKLRGFHEIAPIMRAFDEQMNETEHISAEDSRRILDNLEKFLFPY